MLSNTVSQLMNQVQLLNQAHSSLTLKSCIPVEEKQACECVCVCVYVCACVCSREHMCVCTLCYVLLFHQ